MSDYIKREDAIKIINSGISIDTYADKRYVNGLFRAIRPADVAPVRHGRWALDTAHTEEIYAHPVKCSVCGRTEVLGYETLTPYCPNCGAKMDEEVE